MPRGRPRKLAISVDIAAEDFKLRNETDKPDVLAEAKDNSQIVSVARGKVRGRPRQPRPEVLNASDNVDVENINDNDSKAEDRDETTEDRNNGRRRAGQKSLIECEFCGKVFKFRATLKQHEQIHYGIKEFECEVCNRRFLHKGTLKVHLRMHTGEMPYQCPHCPKQFRGQTALDCHIFRHTKQGTKCPQCPSIFATPSIVKQHIREVHTTERVNTCQICGVTYKHLKSLRLHLRNHQKRVCPDCGKVFHSVYAMMTHRKIHAQDHFQFKCNFCDRKFEQEDELMAHGKLRGRAYQCEMCCHSFNKADYLENHNRRNHWKELGLEQLKIAPPKNGWNRKGVPKPKKPKGDTETIEIEPVEVAYNVDIPPSSETWPNYVEPNPENAYSADLYPQEIPLTVETFCQTTAEQPKTILKSESETEYEHIECKRFEPVQQEHRLECDHDYVGDDFHFGDENNDGGAEGDNHVVCEEPKTEIKDEPVEVVSGNPQLAPEVPMEELVKVSSADSIPKVEAISQFEDEEDVQIAETKEIKVQESSSDEEDDKPLSTWVSKPHQGRFRKNSNQLYEVQPNDESSIIEQAPMMIKDDASDKENPEYRPDDSPSESIDDVETPARSKRSKRKLEPDHLDVQETFCPFCGDSFKSRLDLRKHKKIAHSDLNAQKGPFICEICGKSYANITSLVCHRNRHEEYQRFKCDECPKAFAFRCYLETHKRAEHLHERLICPLCGKQFKYSQDLKVHTRQHEDDKPFKCDQCPSSFRYPSALRSHKAWHEQTVFTCDICSKTFKYANSLRVHKRLHSGVKRFRCDICDREFNTKAPLVRHLATHSVEREIKCVVCDRIFYKKVDLVIHQSKEHPNDPAIGKTIKIHRCDVCGQEFAKKSNLKAHSYIHGDVYKFKCKLCEDQQFKQHAGLRHHLIHFHKMDPSKRKTDVDNEATTTENGEGDKQPERQSSTVNATLTPAISIIHNGVAFSLQQVQCE